MVDGFLHGRRHAHDAGHILGAAPLALFLLAALDEVLEGDAPADVQRADALGAVELMAGQGEHINVHLFHVDGHVTHRLDGVGVEGDLLLPTQGADLFDGLHGADLVVGEHDGDQAGVLSDGVGHVLDGDDPVGVDVQEGDVKAFLLQLCQGVEDGVVLELGGDDMALALLCAYEGGGTDGLVVGFAAAAGEINFTRLCAQTFRHRLSGFHEGFCRPLTQRIKRGRIAIFLGQEGHHCRNCCGADLSGRRVIRIYIHFLHLFPSYFVGI